MWWSFSMTSTYRWFSPGPPVSSTNKTDRHDIAEMLLNTINCFITNVVQMHDHNLINKLILNVRGRNGRIVVGFHSTYTRHSYLHLIWANTIRAFGLWCDVLYCYVTARRGHDRMVVGFTTTYAIIAFHHWCLWVRNSIRVRCTTWCDEVFQWLRHIVVALNIHNAQLGKVGKYQR
jgi:hypothetical protein